MMSPELVIGDNASNAADFVVAPVPPFAILIAVPLHTPLIMVPTLVKLEPVTVEAKLVPVKVPASAIKLVVVAEVTLPFASTVIDGINVDDPYVFAVTPEFARVVVNVPVPVPVTSPVKVIAVSYTHLTLPTNREV